MGKGIFEFGGKPKKESSFKSFPLSEFNSLTVS